MATGHVRDGCIFPVGFIVQLTTDVDPAEYFGGKWQRIKGRFLLAADDANPAGATGGEAEHTLTVEEMPKHRHSSDSYQNGYPDFNAMADTGNFSTWINNGQSDNNNPNLGQDGHIRTSYVGGGQPHNNMPPYRSVYIWERIR